MWGKVISLKFARFSRAILLMAVCVFIVGWGNPTTKTTWDGDKVTIQRAGYRVEATLKEDFTYSPFLLVGSAHMQSNMPFTVVLSAIPMTKVETLREKYGNFRRCGGKGEREGKRSIQTLALFMDSDADEAGLKELISFSIKGSPAVELNAARLKILSINNTSPAGWKKVLGDPLLVRGILVLDEDDAGESRV